MKTAITLVLLALCAPVFASETEDLADRPQAYVEDGVCHIHGAVWARGPVRNALDSLIEVNGPGVYEARTDHRGEYRISILVQERAGFTARFQEGGVRARLVARKARWTNPLVVCNSGSVSVGAIKMVQ